MSTTATLITSTTTTTTTTPNDGSPLTGRWSDDLCGCSNNCCPSGLGFLLFIPFAGNVVLLTCVPCLVGQISGRASYRPNLFGCHQQGVPPHLSAVRSEATRSNCMQGWLICFLLFAIPNAYAVFEYCAQFIGVLGDMMIGFAVVLSIIALILNIVFYSNFRTWMRTRYNIPEESCCDCGVMFFCFPCALAQMYKHVYAENTGCNIYSDPGPHAGGDNAPMLGGSTGGSMEKTAFVTAHAQPVMATAHAQPVMATAQPVVVATQPVAVVAQPQPVVVTATYL